MTTTVGYLQGPSGAPNAKAITVDLSNPVLATNGVQPAGIVLTVMYWPAPIPHARPGFADGNVPFRCPAGTCLTLPYYEAAAIVAAGAAKWV